jgi:archaellum component FlaC
MDEENKDQSQDIVTDEVNVKELKVIKREMLKIKSTYSTILALHKKYVSKEDGIIETINKSNEAKSSLEEVKMKINDLEGNITQNIKDIDSKKLEIDAFMEKIEDYKSQIYDEEIGIEKVIQDASEFNNGIEEEKGIVKESLTEFKNQIKVGTSNIDQIKEEVIKKKVLVENYHKEVETFKDEIESYNKSADEMVEKISNILNLVTDSGLANSFDSRRKRVENGMKIWRLILTTSVLLSVGVLLLLFGFNDKIFEMNNIQEPYMKFLFKLTLSSPLIFAIWFSSIQYSKERHILEQYEYKTATALALEQYTRLLEEKFEEGFDEDKFNFVTDLINKVYKEPEYPSHGTAIEGKFKFPYFNKEVDIKAKAEETKA